MADVVIWPVSSENRPSCARDAVSKRERDVRKAGRLWIRYIATRGM